uniref:MASE3 domain-containing protein n=1 Tax=Hylemonella sp. TaxID=2066020 RepID=UPI0035AFBA2A
MHQEPRRASIAARSVDTLATPADVVSMDPKDTEEGMNWRAQPARLAPAVVVTLVCLAAAQVSYLLFHTLAEVFSIVIALTALAVAMTSHRFTRNHYTIHLAVAIGWCAALDLVHTLVFPGMGLLPFYDANLAPQFWIAARFLQAAALLVAPLYLRRVAHIGRLQLIYGGLALLATVWIFSGHFPETYVAGEGLTPFKIYAEYLIITMLVCAVALSWRNRALMAPRLYLGVQAALVMMILSEFAFTRYVNMYGGANQLGHIFKIFAYWFVYLALVQNTLRLPFGMLARTAGTFDAIPDPVLVVGTDGRLLQFNRAAVEATGLSPRVLAAGHVHTLFHDPAQPAEACPVCARIGRGEQTFVVEIERDAGERSLEFSVAPYWPGDPARGVVQVVRDITERKHLADEREQLVTNLAERIKELRTLYDVSRLLERGDLEMPALLQEIAAALRAAFFHPDQMRVAVCSEQACYGDAAALEVPDRLERLIRVDGQVVGRIVAAYAPALPLAERAFLTEEQALLGTLAQHLGEAMQRRQAERQVRRLSYLYNMLSAANRAIVRCSSEAQLLQEVHAALVQHGAFPKLFIALSEAGSLPLRLIHVHGVDDTHRPHLEAVLADRAGPLAPRYADLHAGHTLWVPLPPVGTDAWNDWLHAEGIGSRALVPLMCQGLVHGVIGLYGEGETAFDEAQVGLLDELAADLAFALNGLATEQRRQRAEQRAELSDLRFREVFESSPLPMQILATDSGTTLAINRAHRDWLGYDLAQISAREDWLGTVYADLGQRAALLAHWQEAVLQARASGTVVRSPELTLRARDGGERIAQGTMTLVDGDAIIAWTDLTEIRRSEQALRASELHFRTMIEQTVMGVYVRRGSRFLYVNPRYCELVGWSREELEGQEIWRFTGEDPDTVQRIRTAWLALEAGESAVHYNVPLRCKSGEVRELALHASRIQWDGEPADIVVAEDVTERQQAAAQIARQLEQLEAAMRGTLQAVSNMIDQRDPYTAGHERRVGLIAGAIGAELGWDAKRCEMMELVGLVHDIGKIGVPAEILTKPTRLSELEMALMRQHAEAGYQILKDVPFSFPVADIIRQHHERLDGSGYPQGLKGEQILPEARVLAVADVIESIATHRPYRPARGMDAALAELERGRGTHYDAEVIDAFGRLLHEKGYVLPQ